MAARWMSPILRRTTRRSGVQDPVEAPALSPRFVLWLCWRAAHNTCVPLSNRATKRILGKAQMDEYATDERTLAEKVIPSLRKGMLCMADRLFPSYKLWRAAAKTGADLLWRTRQKALLDVEKRLPDGSYLSRIYASTTDRRNKRNGIVVRVIDYRLKDVPGADPLYRLITTIFDPQEAPAKELAALYHERWEIETTLDELKTHLRGAQIVLRSKTPELVRQEFFGLLMAHFAIRGLMHEAALKADEDPDRLSFIHSVHIVQRRMARYGAIPPSAEKSFPRSDPR